MKQWHKVTVDFAGPKGGEDASTFLDHRLDVTFTNKATGTKLTVPGFFAADGDAADSSATSGNVWRVNFTPPEAGEWTYKASFRKGNDVAVADNMKAGSSGGYMDGKGGSFRVADSNKSGDDMRAKGTLEYTGDQYLKFAEDGEIFLKSGMGSPENFLAYKGFDGTPNHDQVHEYKAHRSHFRSGDPTWSGGEGKEIIGAVNYLADKGLNSFYMLLMNVGGDGRDVWPWADEGLRSIKKSAGDSQGSFNLGKEARSFDVSKLEQWEIVFEHMQKKGMVLHLFLQETENDHLLNDGNLGTERKLFMREMVARFGHHNGVIWNLGEENTNDANDVRAHSQWLKALDAYDHPVALHTYPQQHNRYEKHDGEKTLDVLSFQTNRDNDTPNLDKYLGMAKKAGREWVAFLDEPGDAKTGTAADGDRNAAQNHDNIRDMLWEFYLEGGSGMSTYAGYGTHGGKGGDLLMEDFSIRKNVYDFSVAAREFFERLPLEKMKDGDHLTTGTKVNDEVLAQEGKVYAIYLEEGGSAKLNLSKVSGTFKVSWYDPRTGDKFLTGSVKTVDGGKTVSLGEAPYQTGREWAVLVEKISGGTGSGDSGSGTSSGGNQEQEKAPTSGGSVTARDDGPINVTAGKRDLFGEELLANDSGSKLKIVGVSTDTPGKFDALRVTGDGEIAAKLKGNVTGEATFTYKVRGGSSETSKADVTLKAGGSSSGSNDGGSKVGGSTDGGSKADLGNQFAINIGSTKAFKASDGTTFAADTTKEGRFVKKSTAIKGTSDDALYRTEARSTNKLDYEFDVDNGNYAVTFHFAEIWKPAFKEGVREFDIFLEGKKVVDDYDIFAEAGKKTAHTETYTVNVRDGELDIMLKKGKEFVKLNALEVEKAGGKSSNMEEAPQKPGRQEAVAQPQEPAPEPQEPAPVGGNRAPVVNDEIIVVDYDKNVVVYDDDLAAVQFDKWTLFNNDSDDDFDGDGYNDMQLHIVRDPSQGTLQMMGEGSIIEYYFDPTAVDAKDTFTYRASDEEGATSNLAKTTLKFANMPGAEPELDTIFLVDARSDKALFALGSSTVVEADSVRGMNLTVSAEVDEDVAAVESAKLFVDGELEQIESVEPYALFGDRSGDFDGGLTLGAGDRVEVGVEYFARDNGAGSQLGGSETSIAVENNMIRGGLFNAADVYAFDETRMGEDTLRYFEELDTLVFFGDSGLSADDIANRAEVVDGDTVIDFGGGNVLTLGNFTGLDAGDILA